MDPVTIQFLGATDTVTGSRFLVSSSKSRILIDCGMFQGMKSVQAKNWEPFPVGVHEIDAVVLTHAHLDHSGYLPRLVKEGFQGPIYSTGFTKKLAAIVLRDSAHLQEMDAEFADKRAHGKGQDHEPLYSQDDAERTIDMVRECGFRTPISITEDATVTFYPSGHILGSSFLVLEIGGKKFLFTSDLGRNNHPLLSNPDAPPAIDINVVITESTYGDRLHETPVDEFVDEINAALKRGGSILIPAFAIDRTEVILMELRELMDAKRIPAIPVLVDSPMALAALNYYREAVRDNHPEIREGVSTKWANQDPFDAGTLGQMLTTDESKSIADMDLPSIIISASGMATGGRVVHHLANMLPDPKNTVIMVGYQGMGSRGRMLVDGAQEIKIHGEDVPVNAHIANVEAFSVHADSDELMQWLSHVKGNSVHAFVVHGEPESQAAMKVRIKSELHWETTIPVGGEIYTI